MGLIRKSLSIATGAAFFPGIVQYRSDTERGTHQTKLLRQDEARRHQEAMTLAAAQARLAAARAGLDAQVALNAQAMAQANYAPVQYAQEIQSAPAKQSDLLAEIERLHALHLAGALTKEEFESEKRSRMSLIAGL